MTLPYGEHALRQIINVVEEWRDSAEGDVDALIRIQTILDGAGLLSEPSAFTIGQLEKHIISCEQTAE